MKIQNRYIFLILSLLFMGVCFYFFFNIVIYLLLAFVLSTVGQPLMKFLFNKVIDGLLK